MSATINKPNGKINDWTVMFFFASDNELSPLILSQLKSIKEAGFQENTDVLVYFDANEKGAPTKLYRVNHRRKTLAAKKTKIGDGEDPYVRTLVHDDIDPKDIETTGKPFSDLMSKSLLKPDTAGSLDSLKNFIGYARENHKAKHYMLFLVGHGMIVGNDAFLPDETPNTAIELVDLGKALREFGDSVKNDGGAFDLLALHSCSMSAIEVAYELKDTANYMMASEGISFVGSFPYRHLLKKLFKSTTDEADKLNVERLLQKIYFLSLYNSTDFMVAGYSSDLTLCSLDPVKLQELKEKLVILVSELKKGLSYDMANELILLAHHESQSYWNESYTDLYDFCLCLQRACEQRLARYGADAQLTSLSDACGDVVEKLERDRSNAFSKLVVFSEHLGSKYQYSHGLSVYFPWVLPMSDKNEPIMAKYEGYAFTSDFPKEQSWSSFLNAYFANTLRDERTQEDQKRSKKSGSSSTKANMVPDFTTPTTAAATNFAIGALERKPSGAFERKASGAAGGDCSCPSIKNYPDFSISPGAALAFSPDSDDPLPGS